MGFSSLQKQVLIYENVAISLDTGSPVFSEIQLAKQVEYLWVLLLSFESIIIYHFNEAFQE